MGAPMIGGPLKRTVTAYDQGLASFALGQMQRHRLSVVLVPGERGGLIRAVEDENPEFYRFFLETRRYSSNRKKPRTPGYRQRVRAALQRIVDNRPCARADWIGWELLDILELLDA